MPRRRAFERTTNEGISADRAVAWLQTFSATWEEADVPEAKIASLQAVYERIVVTGRTIVSIRLTPSAYGHGLVLALPDNVAMARPTGVERADARNIRIPIEGAGKFSEATA